MLLDLNMPIMTGWEVLAWLQAAHAGIAVVFMTAGQGAKAEAERCHADGYLTNPLELDDLLAVAARFLPAVLP